MKPIATDIADFEALKRAGQIYVDKTAYLHKMITDPSRKFFFCARPHRLASCLVVDFRLLRLRYGVHERLRAPGPEVLQLPVRPGVALLLEHAPKVHAAVHDLCERLVELSIEGSKRKTRQRVKVTRGKK